MKLSKTAYEKILREYDQKQLAAKRESRLRTLDIQEKIPQLAQINTALAHMSADLAVERIKGGKTKAPDREQERAALLKKRDELLKAAGYPPDYMEPRYECSICRDTGYAGNEKCRCLRARMIEVLYDQSNIKKILEKENFDTYSFKYYSDEPMAQNSQESPLSIAKKAVAASKKFIDDFSQSSDNIFISGGTGTGKTFLCNCIARELLNRGTEVIYLSAVSLFDILADNAFRDAPMQWELGDLSGCELLIIDDLGTEYTNSFVQSAFFNCINERLLRGKHTIISTNLSIEQIGQNYSERVFSRITQNYILIKLFGEDIRIIKKMED